MRIGHGRLVRPTRPAMRQRHPRSGRAGQATERERVLLWFSRPPAVGDKRRGRRRYSWSVNPPLRSLQTTCRHVASHSQDSNAGNTRHHCCMLDTGRPCSRASLVLGEMTAAVTDGNIGRANNLKQPCPPLGPRYEEQWESQMDVFIAAPTESPVVCITLARVV